MLNVRLDKLAPVRGQYIETTPHSRALTLKNFLLIRLLKSISHVKQGVIKCQ